MKKVHLEYVVSDDFQTAWEWMEMLHEKEGRWYLAIDDQKFYELTEKEAVEWMQKKSRKGLVDEVLEDSFPELLPILAGIRA